MTHSALQAAEPRNESWLGLLASTMGLEDLHRLRVHVRGQVTFAGEARLVVQVAPSDDALESSLRGRPQAAMQRSVTQQELAKGVDLAIYHEGIVRDGCAVVVWLELGGSDHEFGALLARPIEPVALARTTLRDGRARVELASPSHAANDVAA